MIPADIIREELRKKAETDGSWADITSRIEPGVANRPALETQIFLASIAISLKRIADTLDRKA